MKRITIAMLKNINKYFIDKYYDEICNDIYDDNFIFNGEFIDDKHPFSEFIDKHPFIDLQHIMMFSSSAEKYVDISNDTLKWICEFVENKQDYDKLSKYGDFYYKIKLILNNN